MSKHEEKYCPKCGSSFVCKAGDILNCQCNAVQLSEDAIRFLEKTSYDCLCRTCLVKLNNDLKVARIHQFPTQKEMLIEGLHYYKENNYSVFTELYHLLRGSCCKSGCRHCVYGFIKRSNG